MLKVPFLLLALSTLASAAASPETLQGVTPQRAMQIANSWKGNGVRSFVSDQAIEFTFPDGRRRSVPLPAQQMVVAVAPYIERTHPCKTHFMSGCQGELVGTPVKVKVTDRAGKTVLNKTIKTLPNGFLELWLRRGQTYSVTLSALGKSVKGQLRTVEGSPTCITTLRLR